MVLIIVATVVGALTPSVARQITHARINRAANVVAGDFYLAQSLAVRQRSPVIMTFDGGLKTTTIALPSGTALFTRRFDIDSEFKLSAFSASPASVTLLPSGMANSSVTVTIGGSDYNKRVRMTRAGQIRIIG